MEKDPNVYDPAEDTMMLAKNLDVRMNDRVLEIGVGSGYILLVASQKAESVFGIDINPERMPVQRAIEINSDVFNIINGRINSLPNEEIIEAYFDPENHRGDIEMILAERMK